MKQRNIFGLALIDTGNLVHSVIVSGDFWESIGGKISSPMDHRVGTADGQSEGLQVLGIGEPWPIYLEGMEECYVLEPLVIRGLSHSVNLAGVQPEDDLHRGGGRTDACKRWFGWRMP